MHSSNELYGSDRTLFDTVRTLDPVRFDPIVVLPSDGNGDGRLGDLLKDAGFTVHIMDLAVLRRRYLSPLGLLRLLVTAAADVRRLGALMSKHSVQLCYSNSSAVISGSIAARVYRVPHVWHVREIVAEPAFVGRALKWLINNLSTDIIVVSDAVRVWLAPSRRPVDVIYHGLDDPIVDPATRSRLRSELVNGRSGPLVGWVSRISTWKGHDTFVSMAELAAERFPQATFVLAGGPVPGLETLASALNDRINQSPYRDRIRYVGFRSDGPALVAALDVLVACPSRPDPFPRVVQEAMWQGVPVLATATGGLPELVSDGITGGLVHESGAVPLADRLGRMLDDPDGLARMGRASRKLAEERYNMPQYVHRLEAIFDRALSAPARQSGDRA